jgi:hypothetical protein
MTQPNAKVVCSGIVGDVDFTEDRISVEFDGYDICKALDGLRYNNIDVHGNNRNAWNGIVVKDTEK